MNQPRRNVIRIACLGIALGCLASVLASKSEAAESVAADATWTAPTTYIDGTPIAAGDITEYRVYNAVDSEVSNDPESVHIKVTSATSKQVTLSLVPRATPYVVKFGVRAKTKNGEVSALSNIDSVSFLVQTSAAANAPTNVQINITCTSGCVITPITNP